MTSLVVYTVLYYQDIKGNVLTLEDQEDQWTSKDSAFLHYSFYFVLVSVLLYATNILVIVCSGFQCSPLRYKDNITPKSLDGVMMY